jgi:hypothetical protein
MSLARIVPAFAVLSAAALGQAPSPAVAPGAPVPSISGSSIGAAGASVPVLPGPPQAIGVPVSSMPGSSIGAAGAPVPLAPNFNTLGASVPVTSGLNGFNLGPEAPVLPGGTSPFILDPFAAVPLGSNSVPTARGPLYQYLGPSTGPAPLYTLAMPIRILPPAAPPAPAPEASPGGRIVNSPGEDPFTPAAPTIYGAAR